MRSLASSLVAIACLVLAGSHPGADTAKKERT